MELELMLFGIIISAIILAAMLYVAFGQITVRKLRKNPATKDALGLEFVSGWDIINVANALALPRKYMRRRKKSFLAQIDANPDLLYQHTTKFDRILAKTFFSVWVCSTFSLFSLMVLDKIGVFE